MPNYRCIFHQILSYYSVFGICRLPVELFSCPDKLWVHLPVKSQTLMYLPATELFAHKCLWALSIHCVMCLHLWILHIFNIAQAHSHVLEMTFIINGVSEAIYFVLSCDTGITGKARVHWGDCNWETDIEPFSWSNLVSLVNSSNILIQWRTDNLYPR